MVQKRLISILAILTFALVLSFGQNAQADDEIVWTPMELAPSAFAKSAGGVIGDYFFVFGGMPDAQQALAFKLSINSWVYATASSNRFSDAGYCVTNDAFYRFGGAITSYVSERYDPGPNGDGVWNYLASPPQPFRRTGNSCAWDGGDYIYINNCDNGDYPSSHFARYSISTNSWESLTGATEPRKNAGLVYLNDMIYLIGGIGGLDIDETICQVYDPSTGEWGLIASHPDEMNFTSSTVITDGRFVYTIGHGGGYMGYTASPHVHFFDPNDGTWNQVNDMPVTRGFALAAYVPDYGAVIHAGGTMNHQADYKVAARMGAISIQGPGFLSGTLVDQFNSTPVPNVEVSIFDSDDNLLETLYTDEFGHYSYTAYAGTYSASFSKEDFSDTTIANILIMPDEVYDLSFTFQFLTNCNYTMGDGNNNGHFNGLDVVYVMSWLKGGPEPPMCQCTPGTVWPVALDFNGSCSFNGLDILYVITYFKGGPAPEFCTDCPPNNL